MKIEVVKTPKKVVDISYCNSPDWAALKKAGVEAVIIRGGYLNKTDTKFHEHVKNAILYGFKIGVYCFIMSETVEQSKAEAAQMLKLCTPYLQYITYPIFADMEHAKYIDKSRRELNTQILRAFCETIEKSGNFLTGVYTNPSFRDSYMNYSGIKGRYNVWLAHWTETKSKYIDGNTTMWQYGTSRYNGVELDSDYCYVDYPSLTKLLRR